MTITLDNSKMTGSLAMELWFGEVEIFMWVSLSTLSEQEMGHNILLMVINMNYL